MARDTRAKILDAATRLFAASDTRGASLRAIAREAGVNSALIHYHFGSREGLFEAAVLRVLTPIQSRRAAMIESLRRSGHPPSARELARLFVEPLLPAGPSDAARETTRLRLLARAFAEQRPVVQDLTIKHFGDLMLAFGELLDTALPHLPDTIKHQRIRFCTQAALETFSGPESERLSEVPGAANRLSSALTDFLAGGLSAPIDEESPPPARS